MSTIFMLDTNMASYIIKGKDNTVIQNLLSVPINALCISVITEAELRYGIKKNPEAKHLPRIIESFLERVEILPWNSTAAATYAELRNLSHKKDKFLGNLDMLIAAHAASINATLVTNAKAFSQFNFGIDTQDWTKKNYH